MKEPKEIWVFNRYGLHVTGPFTISGEVRGDNRWLYNAHGLLWAVPKNEIGFTRKQAVEACYKYHEKKIKQERKKLDEKARLLKKFYSEELYG